MNKFREVTKTHTIAAYLFRDERKPSLQGTIVGECTEHGT
jgi:hypothetical protein